MKLQVKNFDFNIELKNKINVLIIENKKEYREVIYSLIKENDIKNGKILISDNEKLLIPSKHIFTFYDYLTFDINKYCATKLYNKIKSIAYKSYQLETNKLKNYIEDYIYELVKDYDIYFNTDIDFNINNIFKSVDFKIQDYNEISIDRIINYINVINEVFEIDIFVFIGLKDFFTKQEIIEFYKYISYNDFSIVLVENKNYIKYLDKENIYIIDNDLCEI